MTRIRYGGKFSRKLPFLAGDARWRSPPRPKFRGIAAEFFVRTFWTQKQSCRASHGLSNDIHFSYFWMKCKVLIALVARYWMLKSIYVSTNRRILINWAKKGRQQTHSNEIKSGMRAKKQRVVIKETNEHLTRPQPAAGINKIYF